MHMKKHLGKIHVYTGNGSGKTKASLGLALRAIGRGLNVVMIQFMKGQETGERLVQKKLEPNFKIYNFGQDHFIEKSDTDKKEDKKQAHKALSFAKKVVLSEDIDVLILDEINVVLDFGLIPENKVFELLNKKPKGIEVVLTGRGVSERILEIADLVTEMKKIKHYYDRGLQARKGIEY